MAARSSSPPSPPYPRGVPMVDLLGDGGWWRDSSLLHVDLTSPRPVQSSGMWSFYVVVGGGCGDMVVRWMC